jgi:hypothetical protein
MIRTPMEQRQKLFAWMAGTAAGVLIPFAPAVVGLRTLSHRDTDQLYAPVRALVVEALRSGRLPLWNPYEGMGRPLFAEGIHSVLHPISLLGAAIAPASIDFLILAYLVAAAVGAFLFINALGASPRASSGAGLAFALSGYSVSMTGNLVFLAGLATLPWLLAAARKAGAGAPWAAFATALATACVFFSGDTQVAILGLVLGVVFAAEAGGPRGAARSVAAMACGILLAATQILATRGALLESFRGMQLEEWEWTTWPRRAASSAPRLGRSRREGWSSGSSPGCSGAVQRSSRWAPRATCCRSRSLRASISGSPCYSPQPWRRAVVGVATGSCSGSLAFSSGSRSAIVPVRDRRSTGSPSGAGSATPRS